MDRTANRQAGGKLPAEARRESIISAAVRLFSEKGFRGVTTRELAAAVGVSEPILYEHFRSKQDLYDAVFERMFEVALRDVNELMSHEAASSDTREFLLHAATAIATWFRKEPEFVRLTILSGLEHEENGQSAYRRVRARFTDALAGFFESRLGQDPNTTISPAVMAHTFLCMAVHDPLMQILFEVDAHNGGEQELAQMVEIFLHGVESRSTPVEVGNGS